MEDSLFVRVTSSNGEKDGELELGNVSCQNKQEGIYMIHMLFGVEIVIKNEVCASFTYCIEIYMNGVFNCRKQLNLIYCYFLILRKDPNNKRKGIRQEILITLKVYREATLKGIR